MAFTIKTKNEIIKKEKNQYDVDDENGKIHGMIIFNDLSLC
jgi:hypothetical protein